MTNLLLFLILCTNMYTDIVVYFIFKKMCEKPKYDEIEGRKKDTKRMHAQVAKNLFSSPLSPYDRYKDKNSNLYAPRKQGGGVRIEVDEK